MWRKIMSNKSTSQQTTCAQLSMSCSYDDYAVCGNSRFTQPTTLFSDRGKGEVDDWRTVDDKQR